ncbi:MAG: M14 family metallopeptidase [Planctomycetes bacterium]|nr:M14 family metallopeptidase [Planctomycetota bacterium]
MRTARVVAITLVSAVARASGPSAPGGLLPPAIPWNGASRALAVSPGDPWATPFEKSGLTRTPRYDETIAWLERLVKAAPELRLVSLGKSPEGRDIWMVVASKDRAFTPEALRATGKPIFLAQGGIHAGEIDGKDAGMMLLRDMTVRSTQKELLDRASFLFVPIFNVDGHERFSAFGRINQRGPEEMGWRTTSRNLNLNRDYGKLDTPETRAMVRAIDAWSPDLYADLHVTDGGDYQYDVTWGSNRKEGYSPESAKWLDEVLRPVLERDLKAAGHVPGPLVNEVDSNDLSKGIGDWMAPARFSNGYGDLRHVPSILVENHSLKPYDQRVLGTEVWLASVLRTLGESGAALRKAIDLDRARRRDPVPLDWKPADVAPPRIEFLGIESTLVDSEIAGGPVRQWNGKPFTLSVPHAQASAPAATVARPRAYWIPPQWTEVIERLAIHGVKMERIAERREVDVEIYRIVDAKLASAPSQGHVPVTATFKPERAHRTFAPGSVRVSTDQPLGDLAILLLEPQSPESFFQWGFFLEALEETEYAEDYVTEPLARKMLAENPALKAEFDKAVAADLAFAKDPSARLRWFYRRSPYADATWNVYPIARE